MNEIVTPLKVVLCQGIDENRSIDYFSNSRWVEWQYNYHLIHQPDIISDPNLFVEQDRIFWMISIWGKTTLLSQTLQLLLKNCDVSWIC